MGLCCSGPGVELDDLGPFQWKVFHDSLIAMSVLHVLVMAWFGRTGVGKSGGFCQFPETRRCLLPQTLRQKGKKGNIGGNGVRHEKTLYMLKWKRLELFSYYLLNFFIRKANGSQRGEVCALPGCQLPLIGKIT